MAEESSKLTTAKTILSTVASVAATAVVVRSVIRKYIPHELQYFLWLRLFRFLSRFDNELTLVIDEYAGLVRNEIYSAAKCYLVPKISPDTRRLSIIKNRKEKNIEIYMEKDEMILDVYNGEKLKWAFVVKTTGLAKTASDSFSQRLEARSFELSFHKRNMDMVINSYLPHIIREANLTEQQKKTLKIHTVNYDYFYGRGYAWNSVNLDHPATFDTLAMDTDQKDAIMKDLEMFVERRDYYRRVGKAWKRGYLLYGPAGTGKSSLIAAIANFLNFDIYDLELTDVKSNSNLRKVLLETANKSILVVEDIDCTIDLQNRKRMLRDLSDMDCDLTTPVNRDQNKVTLSGLLNFTDGLWSSCGDERIIIFTTNHKENLEPALLRPGRMDVHIHMSYCTPSGFKILANNYLGLKDHPLFKDIEDLLRTMNVTPADVAEQLLKQNQNNGPEASLHGLLEFLHEMKRKRAEEEEEEALQQKKKIDDDDKKVTSTEDDEFCSD